MNKKNRKQVRIGTEQEDQMIALVKKAVNLNIEKTYKSKKDCAEAAMTNFKETSGIDPSAFTTIDCVAHHIGTLEKIFTTGVKPNSGKTKNIQTVIIEKVYPATYGKLKQANNAEQMNMNLVDIDPQEDQMEKDAEEARKEEPIVEFPFNDPPLPEDFDIWQSDAYSFLTAFCKYSPDGEGTVTMSLKAFEMLFRRQYERRGIA